MHWDTGAHRHHNRKFEYGNLVEFDSSADCIHECNRTRIPIFLSLNVPLPPTSCAKTLYSRLMKLSDFQYNYIGHHLKEFLVNSNLGCCHGNTFVKECLGKNFSFS